MVPSVFFPSHGGVRLEELFALLGTEPVNPEFSERIVNSVAPVYRGRSGDICYLASRKYKDELATCQASAIICSAGLQSLIPSHIAVLLAANPALAFAKAGEFFHPGAMRPVTFNTRGISPAAFIDPSANLEGDVNVEPMAMIGAHAMIGSGSTIGAGVIVGPNVKIGRNCSIAAGASVLCCHIGNGVIIHNGARIGQDGFGYAADSAGMSKIVQIGRVIIQDHVEIGANTTIDRGTMDDTIIGEGTKIDNQVQIGHNVRIGRHCAIVAKVGIAGSTVIGDGVMIGGAAGLNGHITIGDGVQIAAMSGVIADIPAGQKYGGNPARPFNDYLRATVETLNRTGKSKRSGRDQND